MQRGHCAKDRAYSPLPVVPVEHVTCKRHPCTRKRRRFGFSSWMSRQLQKGWGLVSRDQQKLEDLVKTSIKLNLYCSEQVRTMRAILVWCTKMGSEDPFIMAAKGAAKKYDDVAKGLKGKLSSEE
eukprot:6376117-Karenia_brevis.AAC.1